jgi:helix-turn-helix protein
METYPRPAVERAMKVQEVILRAVARKITWAQAGEIIGLCERQMRRWKERYQEFGYDGLFDRRLGKPSPKRVPLATVEEILRLYQEQYADDFPYPQSKPDTSCAMKTEHFNLPTTQ